MSNYKKSLCKKLISYGEQGKMFSRFCADHKIARRTAYDWVDRHPEFGEAKEIYDELIIAMLEDAGMQAATGASELNYGVLKMLLQAKTKEYKQKNLNGDIDEKGNDKPQQVTITFEEATEENTHNED